LLALLLIASPVAGLRPIRAGLSRTSERSLRGQLDSCDQKSERCLISCDRSRRATKFGLL